MARISTYQVDTNVTGADIWIGTDGNDNKKTKNFSPNILAQYLNENEVISTANSLRYRYDTIASGDSRKTGTISFQTEIGANVPFSSITTFILSNKTLGSTTVDAFLNILPNTRILIQNSSNINFFGIYFVNSITPHLTETGYYVVNLTYVSGNGNLSEDMDYLIHLIEYKTVDTPTPTLQSVTDEGNITTNAITVQSVDYYSLVDTSAVGSQNNTTNSYAYISADGFLGLNNGVVESTLKNTDVTQGINLEFPDKTSGTYTIATTDDIIVPTLQSVTDEGNIVTGIAGYKSTLNGGEFFVDNTSLNTKLRITGDGIVYFTNLAGKTTQLSNFGITGNSVNFIFPNKTSGPAYTLATTADIPSVTGFVPYTGANANLNIGDYNYIGSNITLNGLSTDGGALNISQGPTATINGSGYSSITAQGTDSLNFYLANSLDGKQFNLLTNNITLNDTLNYTLPSTSGTIALISDIPAVTGYVPYTGANQNVNLGEYELKAGQLTLDTTPTGTSVVGTTQWNDTAGVSEIKLKGGNVVLKNGVDLVARVVNKVIPNATLLRANYTAVRISGAQGQRLAVAYAQANNDSNSADTLGLVYEDIATNQEGFIMTMGQFEEINTTGSLQGETWSDGDVLYLSPTTAGRITNIKPTGLTGHIVVMGYVEYAHAIHGKIYVKIMNGWELDELHNVYINQATLANNDGLFYDSSDQLWKNETIASALGYTPANKAGDTFTGNIDAPSMSIGGTDLESLMIAYAVALG